MTERERLSAKARVFFDDLWSRGDPWQLETSGFERDRYTQLSAILHRSHYPCALEIGCGAGAFTRQLAPRTRRLLALDVSTRAIAAAQTRYGGLEPIEFRVANIMDYDPKAEGPWDLIVMSETIYYLGWLYSFFDVAWLASELFAATRDRGQLLLANTLGDIGDPLLLPCIVRTYRDLFLNVGYRLVEEKPFCGRKNSIELEVLISLLAKESEPSDSATTSRLHI
ncbi:MAG TPA: SAM-dependent methyltransferase [Terriglobales bacterium]|jgi:SAM-dependent methyltransferase|nr:SAM-dependent methyltransferase [Terriglobales bacterium]